MFEFGTSGFLHQSNKLMFDRQTDTLWQSLTGEPVVGRLAHSGLQLEFLPVEFTTWADWRERNPDTSVLALEQGQRVEYLHPDDPNAVYSDYFSSPDVWFPPYLRSDEVEQKSRVYGVEVGNAAIAYPLDALREGEVVNDTVGIRDVVITFDPDSSLTRSYERGDRTFTRGPNPGELLDDSGVLWVEGEEGLAAQDGSGNSLDRVLGVESFWFGWFAFRPHSQVYSTQ